MNLKKLFIIASALFSLFISSILLADTKNTESRTLGSFNSLNISGAYTIAIHVGQPQAVTVSGTPDIIKNVLTDIKDNVLYIHSPGSFNLGKTQPAKIDIKIPALTALKIDGMNTLSAELIKGENFAVETAGKQNVTLSGEVKNLTVQLMGSNTFDAEKLMAQSTTLKAAGISDVKIYASKEFKVQTTGNITVKLFGKPKVVSSAMIGGGQLQVSD